MKTKKKQLPCYWCTQLMDSEYITVEHMSSKFARCIPGMPPKTLACRTCNGLRSKMECLIVNPPSNPKRKERYPAKLKDTLERLPPRLLHDIEIRFPVNF